MIYKNWHVPIGLYIIRLVCKPWLGRRLPGRNFIYESQIMQHLIEKYLWSRVMSGKVHVLVLRKRTTPRQNVSHTFWGLTTQPAPRLVWIFWFAYNRVGNSCSYSSIMPAIVCVGQDFHFVSHQKHPLAFNCSSCNLVVTRLPYHRWLLTSSFSFSTRHFRSSVLTLRGCSK